ncbi:MAG: sodium:solute symporter [Nitrososphaerota archaeon]|nr:sodium:solute symporter [Nitrososphaerota archaeon]
MPALDLIIPFVILFGIFAFLGFYGSRWRKGNLDQLHDWALAGRKLGVTLSFFLVGADLYTAYTFVALPSSIFVKGSLYFYAVPYTAVTFGVALAFAPKLWEISRKKGYVTASDFIRDRFNSRTLSILVAVTGIVAVTPYIALQIVGMQAILSAMFVWAGVSATNIEQVSLIGVILILAAFTHTSGLRGATLTAVFKSVLIWPSIVVVIVAVLIKLGGNFSTSFADAPPKYLALSYPLVPSYVTLVIGSALALYLYPHAVNGILSAESAHKLRLSTSLLPINGLGLALLGLLGILINSIPPAMQFLDKFPAKSQGIYVVPSLVLNILPGWLAGVVLLGIFVGGLVPAAIMAISQSTLLSRNIVKEFKPNLSAKRETDIAKWSSVAFKFIALAFVFIVPASYAIELQLLGGIVILQLLPSIFIGLYSKWFRKEGLIAGLLIGTISGIFLAIEANNFGPLNTSLFSTPFGSLYIAVIALGLNLVITTAISGVLSRHTLPVRSLG